MMMHSLSVLGASSAIGYMMSGEHSDSGWHSGSTEPRRPWSPPCAAQLLRFWSAALWELTFQRLPRLVDNGIMFGAVYLLLTEQFASQKAYIFGKLFNSLLRKQTYKKTWKCQVGKLKNKTYHVVMETENPEIFWGEFFWNSFNVSSSLWKFSFGRNLSSWVLLLMIARQSLCCSFFLMWNIWATLCIAT